MTKKTSPFDYVRAISEGPAMPFGTGYSPFLTARSFSNYPDTLGVAAQVNRLDLTPEQHYRFLLSTVRKRKRYARWRKPETDDRIEAIMRYYKCRPEIARQYLRLLPRNVVAEMVRGDYDRDHAGEAG